MQHQLLVNIVSQALSVGIVIAQIGIIVAVIGFLLFRKKCQAVFTWLGKNGVLLAWTTAVIATSGSLFYSLVAGFAPCELCWYQRILMYPLVVILGLALIKKESTIIADYALSLSGIGILISLYHNYIYYTANSSACQIFGNTVSCTKRYVSAFGYMTIPMMALTAFALVIIFLLFYKLQDNGSVTR